MHKYTKLLQHLTYRQMKQLSFDQLEQQGITAQGPRNKLIGLLGDIDVDDLEEYLTPDSSTPPSSREGSTTTAAAAPVLVASGHNTPEGNQGGPSALVCDTIVTARTEAARPDGTPAQSKLNGALQPVPVAVVEAATVCEDSSAEPPYPVQTQPAASSLQPQENNANQGQHPSGPSALQLLTISSFKLKPTATEFKPKANRRLHNQVVVRNFRDLHPKPEIRRFWNGWLWQHRLGYLLPPPDASPNAFLPMDFPVPRTSGLAPPDGQQRASTLHREDILESGTGNQGKRQRMEEVNFDEDARNPELPEGVRDLAARLIRMVDELTA